MVALMWIGSRSLDVARWTTVSISYGIEPREADGLDGVVTAPFLHVGFGHLIANTIPFLVMGVVIALRGAAAPAQRDRDRDRSSAGSAPG